MTTLVVTPRRHWVTEVPQHVAVPPPTLLVRGLSLASGMQGNGVAAPKVKPSCRIPVDLVAEESLRLV